MKLWNNFLQYSVMIYFILITFYL